MVCSFNGFIYAVHEYLQKIITLLTEKTPVLFEEISSGNIEETETELEYNRFRFNFCGNWSLGHEYLNFSDLRNFNFYFVQEMRQM